MIKAAHVLSGIAVSLLVVASPRGSAAAERPGWEQAGKATWYGPGFHGRRTASGERYDQNAMTAAHPTLPLGSRVEVTRHATGETVTVTINDRQPAAGVRIIDLSRAAAARIGLVQHGIGWVTVRRVDSDAPIEVAEAPDDAPATVSPRRYGPPHRRHARP